ncbi:MAG: MotA/TolQ/ExbB proton channel family protein [Deltaproteobacteria bacterium]|nr:MotA/TolQ/ExbB proton channel family protein [Deltaproteobacteria bacterium]
MVSTLIGFISNAYAQVETATQTAAENTVNTIVNSDVAQTAIEQPGLWSHILNADPVVKLTLLLLVFFSITCWAVIFFKSSQLMTAQKTSKSFWHRFSASPTLSDLVSVKSIRQGPLYEIFATGHVTLGKFKNAKVNKMSDYHRSLLAQRMNQSREEEIYKLEQYVSFLATTASVAPFIGLFGTVWGILTAFMAIGKAGSSSLATVGPYISEALVATAIGLFAAIPAVIFYNYFVGKIRIINKMIDLFMEDFLIKSEQEIAA